MGRKERRKLDNFNKEKLAIFHHTIINDNGIGNIDKQILKLQEAMKVIDNKFKFPKVNKSEVNRTMIIVNNISEILDNQRQQEKRYPKKEGNVQNEEERANVTEENKVRIN